MQRLSENRASGRPRRGNVSDEAAIGLTLPPDATWFTVARLVVGGVGARKSLTVEEIENIQLGVEAMLAAGAQAGESLDLEIRTYGDSISIALHAPISEQDDRPLGIERLLDVLGAQIHRQEDALVATFDIETDL